MKLWHCSSFTTSKSALMSLLQAVGKALREREQALLTVHALEAELRRKKKGIDSLEEAGSQVRHPISSLVCVSRYSLSFAMHSMKEDTVLSSTLDMIAKIMDWQGHSTFIVIYKLMCPQVFGGDKGKTRKVSNLQSDVAALEAALEAARAEYDRVLERNIEVTNQPAP